jgi:hypothetical protein
MGRGFEQDIATKASDGPLERVRGLRPRVEGPKSIAARERR